MGGERDDARRGKSLAPVTGRVLVQQWAPSPYRRVKAGLYHAQLLWSSQNIDIEPRITELNHGTQCMNGTFNLPSLRR